MQLNTFVFLFFFLAFFSIYWFALQGRLKLQNLFLLAGSYVFYAWWDWRFLGLIIGSSLFNYWAGNAIESAKKERHKLLWMRFGVILNLSVLLFFKYFNFFIDTLNEAFHSVHVNLNLSTLHLILPLGISFYTFRTISYLLEVYNENIPSAKSPVIFFNYVSFFPCFLAGPIDRPGTFIPQLESPRVFSYNEAARGLRQILWGLFKKVIIADNCAALTNPIIGHYTELSGSTLLLGAFLFTIEIYADFSGYSDMAIGISRLLGFNVSRNFNYPFFSKNIAEFWQKWHISLTSWMTDYVYTPLSFLMRRRGKSGIIIAIIINFILVGFWHGANWTFIFYGFLQGCYFIPLVIRGGSGSMVASPGLSETSGQNLAQLLKIVATFILVMLTTVIFRSETLNDAFSYYGRLLSGSLFSFPQIENRTPVILFTIACMFIMEWLGRKQEFALELFGLKWPRLLRWSFYVAMILMIMMLKGQEQQFIYIQF